MLSATTSATIDMTVDPSEEFAYYRSDSDEAESTMAPSSSSIPQLSYMQGASIADSPTADWRPSDRSFQSFQYQDYGSNSDQAESTLAIRTSSVSRPWAYRETSLINTTPTNWSLSVLFGKAITPSIHIDSPTSRTATSAFSKDFRITCSLESRSSSDDRSWKEGDDGTYTGERTAEQPTSEGLSSSPSFERGNEKPYHNISVGRQPLSQAFNTSTARYESYGLENSHSSPATPLCDFQSYPASSHVSEVNAAGWIAPMETVSQSALSQFSSLLTPYPDTMSTSHQIPSLVSPLRTTFSLNEGSPGSDPISPYVSDRPASPSYSLVDTSHLIDRRMTVDAASNTGPCDDDDFLDGNGSSKVYPWDPDSYYEYHSPKARLKPYDPDL